MARRVRSWRPLGAGEMEDFDSTWGNPTVRKRYHTDGDFATIKR